jgi:hypothetical protein
MNMKLFGAKKAVTREEAAAAHTGAVEDGGDGEVDKKRVRNNSIPTLPTVVKIGDYMKATKITTFKSGKKIVMHVVTGISAVTQAIAVCQYPVWQKCILKIFPAKGVIVDGLYYLSATSQSISK